MRTTRTATRTFLPVLVLATVLAGCSAQDPGTAAPVPAPPASSSAAGAPSGASGPTSATPAGEGAVGVDEEAVVLALTAYQEAIASGDYNLACGQMTVESAGQLVTAVQGAGGLVATCPEALGAVLAQQGAAAAAIEAANTIVVDDVTIDNLSASITWTSQRQGVPRTDTLTLQSIDGQWRLAGPA